MGRAINLISSKDGEWDEFKKAQRDGECNEFKKAHSKETACTV